MCHKTPKSNNISVSKDENALNEPGYRVTLIYGFHILVLYMTKMAFTTAYLLKELVSVDYLNISISSKWFHLFRG